MHASGGPRPLNIWSQWAGCRPLSNEKRLDEPPPAVMRDAGDRALMASRESVKSRRGESGGGPGQGLDGMEEGSSEVVHKNSIDDMV